MVPRKHRRVTRDTWVLIDMKLGAFVRGQFLLVMLVGSAAVARVLARRRAVLAPDRRRSRGSSRSSRSWGRSSAGAVAIGAGLTAGWAVAIGAGIAVLVLRQLEDYVIVPRVMGHAVGLSPLVVLVSVVGDRLSSSAPIYVLIAIPIALVVATLVDVVVRGRDPAEEEAPAVLFAAEARR